MGIDWVGLIGLFISALLIASRSHIVMIACVLVFSAYFFFANKRQRAGKTVIEGTVRNVFEHQTNIEANVITGWFPTYLLRIDWEKLDIRGNNRNVLPNSTKSVFKNVVK
jgi:hypothetical protein